MKRAALFLITIIFCKNILAASPCDSSFEPLSESRLLELISPLERGVMVRSAFEQKRVMRLLKKPLLANGSMIYAPGFGLFWQLDKPFNYQLIMTPQQFTQINGEQKQVINASDQPAMFATSKIFADLFAGDFLAAQSYFSLHGKKLDSEKNRQWALCLIPAQEPFKQLIAYIEIHGGKKINAVRIQDAGDDSTFINFSDLPSGALSNNSPLTDVEKSYFQQH